MKLRFLILMIYILLIGCADETLSIPDEDLPIDLQSEINSDPDPDPDPNISNVYMNCETSLMGGFSVVITYWGGPQSLSTARLTRHGAPKDYSNHFEVGTEDYALFGTSDTFEGLYSQGRVSSRHIIIDRTTLDLRLRDERSEEWSIGSCEKVSLGSYESALEVYESEIEKHNSQAREKREIERSKEVENRAI